MSFDLTELLVGLMAVFPGFLVTHGQRAFRPTSYQTAFDQTMTSLLWSAILNALGLIWVWRQLLLTGLNPREVSIADFKGWLLEIGLGNVVLYCVTLYLCAFALGLLIGRTELTPRAIARRLKLTDYAPADSVWNQIRTMKPPGKVPWVWICKDSKAIAYGLLRGASAEVHQDEPVEAYLSPVTYTAGCVDPLDGLYLRVTDDHTVGFQFHDRGWTPSSNPSQGNGLSSPEST